MVNRLLRAALAGARAFRTELYKVEPIPAPTHRAPERPRDACEVCGEEPTTDVREIRLGRFGYRAIPLRVCATHARVAGSKVSDDLEDAINDGHVRVPNDEVYGP